MKRLPRGKGEGTDLFQDDGSWRPMALRVNLKTVSGEQRFAGEQAAIRAQPATVIVVFFDCSTNKSIAIDKRGNVKTRNHRTERTK